MTTEPARTDWKQARSNPDPRKDLGYDIDDWEEVTARSAGQEHLLFLPSDEGMLQDEAFLVVAPEAMEDLLEMR